MTEQTGAGAPSQIPIELGDVATIIEMPDRIVRNLWITQAYHDLGVRMCAHLTGEQGNSEGSWASYGTWASRTAGSTMRNQELPAEIRDAYNADHAFREALDRVGKHSWLRRLGLVRFMENDTLMGIFENELSRISGHVAEGNGIVFAELAPVYANMIAKFDAGEILQGEALEQFIREQKLEGEPESIAIFEDAIRNYFLAMDTRGQVERAQLVCLANLQAGLHEQQRLQGPIASALDAPVKEGLLKLRYWWLTRLLLKVPVLGWLLQQFDRAFCSLLPEVERLAEVLGTKLMMSIKLHTMTLPLSEDVPPNPDGTMFPPDLEPVVLPQLAELIERWGGSMSTGANSGARNWKKLEDRMRFIFALFRSRQETPGLLAQPFTEQERKLLLSGKLAPPIDGFN